EFEFQMALMNRRLAPSVEIAFLMPSQEYTYLNSTLVKEVARHGGRVRGLVPPGVERMLVARLTAGRRAAATARRAAKVATAARGRTARGTSRAKGRRA
ncbi:MAG: Phosphopantetheine adenylyltransferase, partial [Candidatus Eisenbacteria bacterium]